MSATAVKTNSINLRGSAQIVAEFFGYAINSILYQRGIYDPESFTTVKKYGMRIQVSTDERLAAYLKVILKQLSGMYTYSCLYPIYMS
jgi:mitotic spindle assembly checkpoint protein MAD2